MDLLLFLGLLIGLGVVCYGLYWAAIKLFLWTIDPLVKWFAAREGQKGVDDLLRDEAKDE